MKQATTLLAALLLTGCASSGEYRDYLTAQHAANELAVKEQKPLVRIRAQPGQQITGLAEVEVYAPQAPVQIQQARPNEWAGVANTALGITGTALGITLGGDAAIGLAGAVGKAANHGYEYVNPTPVIAPATQVVRPEVIQAPAPVVVRPDVIQIPTQVIDQPVVVPVAGGF